MRIDEDSLKEVANEIFDAYGYLDMPEEEYLVKYVGSAFLVSVGIMSVALVIGDPLISIPMIGVAVFTMFVAFVWPFLLISNEKIDIESDYYYFVTHLQTLSYTSQKRIDAFREISESAGYGGLSDEIQRFVLTTDGLNVSIDEAARRRASETKSDLMESFYESLAYAMKSGQDFRAFMEAQQTRAKQEYESNYKSKFRLGRAMIDLMTNLIMAYAFIFILVLVIPMILNMDPQIVIVASLVAYSVIQASMLLITHATVPVDYYWYRNDEAYDLSINRTRIVVLVFVVIGVLGMSVSLIAIVQGIIPFSMYSYPVLLIIPYIPLSVYIIKKERDIKSSTDQFGKFIRSLGSTESIKQVSLSTAISTISQRDYDDLDEEIDYLNDRLQLSIKQDYVWESMFKKTQSEIVKRFGRMYYRSRELGAAPRMIAEMIEENYRHLLSLKQFKNSTATDAIGIGYTMTIGSSISFFLSLKITEFLLEVARQISSQSEIAILNTSQYDVTVLTILVFLVVTVNALLSSVMIRVVRQRNYAGFIVHFVFMLLICFLIGWGVHAGFEMVDIGSIGETEAEEVASEVDPSSFG